MSMTRKQAEQAVWNQTHSDYKSSPGEPKAILVLRERGTTIVTLNLLTDKELANRVPEYRPSDTKMFAEREIKAESNGDILFA